MGKRVGASPAPEPEDDDDEEIFEPQYDPTDPQQAADLDVLIDEMMADGRLPSVDKAKAPKGKK